MYRNKEFYLKKFEGRDIDSAYYYAKEQLVCPSFQYEEANARAAFEEKYGLPFMSPEARRSLEQEAKIRELEKKVAVKESKKKFDDNPEELVATGTIDDDGKITLDELPGKTKTKEEFAAEFLVNHPQATPMVIGKAYQKYLRELM